MPPDLGPRARGRPRLLSRDQMIECIRSLHDDPAGLFRVHHAHADLYARARRLFGSWRAAVAAAGIDYGDVLQSARTRSLRTRGAMAASGAGVREPSREA